MEEEKAKPPHEMSIKERAVFRRELLEAEIKRRKENADKARTKVQKRRSYRENHNSNAVRPTVENGGDKITAGYWKRAIC